MIDTRASIEELAQLLAVHGGTFVREGPIAAILADWDALIQRARPGTTSEEEEAIYARAIEIVDEREAREAVPCGQVGHA